VHIPEPVLERIEKAKDQKAEGKQICIDLIQEIKEIEGVAGIHVMAYRQEEFVNEIIHASGVMRNRKPKSQTRNQMSDVRGQMSEAG
jgi:5,10-methylenetetrahydrofolate reductase